jgi:hypothetical protein
LVTVTDWPVAAFPTRALPMFTEVLDKVTAGAVAVPVMLMDWGLPEPLSVTFKVPVRVPVAVGAKVTLMVQVLLTAIGDAAAQLSVSWKSPVAPTAVTVKVPDGPVFVRVTDCAELVVPTAWLENVRLGGVKVTAGAVAAKPCPVRDTCCGLLPALSLRVRSPVRVPMAVGVNVTLMVHCAPASTVALQVLD